MLHRNKVKRTKPDRWDIAGATIACHLRQGRWELAKETLESLERTVRDEERRSLALSYDVPATTKIEDLPFLPSSKHFLATSGLRTLGDVAAFAANKTLDQSTDLAYDIRLVLAGLRRWY